LGGQVSGNQGGVESAEGGEAEGHGRIEVAASAQRRGGVHAHEDGDAPCPADDEPTGILALALVEEHIGHHAAA